MEVALCFGRIDGQSRRLDERYRIQRFTPRRPRSPWSRLNRERATGSIERGPMRPAGPAEVEPARADGRWEAACPGPATATVPDALQQALDGDPKARSFFEALDGRNRYALLHRLPCTDSMA